MARVGMNATLVRSHADEMDRIAQQLQALVAAINGNVSRMHADWMGDDAEHLTHAWQRRSRPALETLAGHVHQLATTARREAHAQDVTSGIIAANGSYTSVGPPGSSSTSGLRWFGALTPGVLAGLPGAAFAFVRDGKNWDTHGRAQTQVERHASGSTKLGAIPMSGDASARAYAEANYSTHAGLDRNGAHAAAAASVGVGVAAAANGKVGNRLVSASGHVDVSAEARAEAKGNASIGRDGAQAHAQVKALAGAQASASVHGEVAGVGATAGATGYAGAGVEAHADAAITAREVKASVHLGAALGLGVGYTVAIDVKPAEVANHVKHIHLF